MFCLSTSRIPRYCVYLMAIIGLLLATARQPVYGQATTAAGTIQGTITDPSGAVIPSASITITNEQTGASAKTTSNASGYYTSGPLIPGTYLVSVTKSGFAPIKATVTVQIGNISNGNLHMAVGSSTQVVEVQAGAIRVDTQQSEVQDVLTQQQIDNLPINGRNFLDLAQLEPGVQLQDGQDFDPTKAGYSSVSFNGVYGRTARLSLDGQDISDETVGTTTLNVTQGSIEEFQVGRSDLDLSNEITSSGSIIVSTKSGTNTVHGGGFYNFRDERAGFANDPGGVADPFQRNQFGGNAGGPFLKDKLFWFGSSERIKQDAFAPVEVGGAFSALSGGYDQSFRDDYSAARVDWNAPHNIHVFGRIAYEVNLAASTFGIGYSRYANRDNTPAYVGGADFATGNMTHSFRASFLKFHNRIADDSAGTLTIVPGALVEGNGGLAAGPNLLAPQATFQSDKQERYDGSWIHGRHTIRYGVSVNDINGGGFASFFGLGPEIVLDGADVSGNPNDPDPTQYAANYLILGNGFGSFTETPAFGLGGGGQHDWRTGIYGGDSWKASRNLTVNYGIRWDRDTGRTDSDLAPIPCSAAAAFGSAAPCSGSALLFNSLGAGDLGARVHQPDRNFGPQAGFAYDLKGNGKTVIRGGAGVYFENNIFNNVLFDRPGKLATGLFNAYVGLCGPFGSSMNIPGVGAISTFNGTSIATLCSEPVGQSGPAFVQLEKYYQQKTAAAGAAANPSYIPDNLTDNYGDFIYSPDYQTPRAVQMNIGVQRQVWPGAVLSVDYLRNVITHIAQSIDVNHVGAARYFNAAAAQNAINTTLTQFGAASIDEAIADGATIANFAGNGLDSGNTYLDNGYPAAEFGLTPDTGAAFPGKNPLWGNMQVSYPLGRSVYNGLQMNYRQQVRSSIPGVTGGSLEVSYAFSRFVSTGGADQFFTPGIYDQDCPTCYIGPSGLDRTHQFSAGGFFQLRHGPMLSFISHLYSSLPTNLTLEKDFNGSPGEIFRTDINGDGLTGDLLPGTEPGAFMRQVKGNSINRLIAQYNSESAGRLTPAGQTLVASGLFTQGQLEQLGAVTPTIATAPSNQDNNPWLRTFDATVGYPIKVKYLGEGGSIEPSISAFNLFNFGYFGTLSGTLESVSSLGQSAAGTVPQAANTTGGFAARDSLRVANGSGTFQQGAPRELEFTMKLKF